LNPCAYQVANRFQNVPFKWQQRAPLRFGVVQMVVFYVVENMVGLYKLNAVDP
jgi:hypothetical protein